MAQNPKFTKETLREFVIEYSQEKGSFPIAAEVKRKFGGGKDDRVKELLAEVIAEIEQDRDELASLPPLPASMSAAAEKMALGIWQEAVRANKKTADALEAQLAARDAELEDARSKHVERVQSLEEIINDETARAEKAEHELAQARLALAKAEKALTKMEAQNDALSTSLKRAETQNDTLNAKVTALTVELAAAQKQSK